MGRATSGVRGMNVSEKGNRVLAVDVARDEDDLFVLTEDDGVLRRFARQESSR